MNCTYLNKENKQCRAFAQKDSEYCFMHDPLKKLERKAAVLKGGLASKRYFLQNEEEVALNNASDAKAFLSRVINGVWRGDIPATPVGNTLGFLVRCFLDAHEKTEVMNKLEELEKIIVVKRE